MALANADKKYPHCTPKRACFASPEQANIFIEFPNMAFDSVLTLHAKFDGLKCPLTFLCWLNTTTYCQWLESNT